MRNKKKKKRNKKTKKQKRNQKANSVITEVVLEGKMILMTCVQNGMKCKGRNYRGISSCSLKKKKTFKKYRYFMQS